MLLQNSAGFSFAKSIRSPSPKVSTSYVWERSSFFCQTNRHRDILVLSSRRSRFQNSKNEKKGFFFHIKFANLLRWRYKFQLSKNMSFINPPLYRAVRKSVASRSFIFLHANYFGIRFYRFRKVISEFFKGHLSFSADQLPLRIIRDRFKTAVMAQDWIFKTPKANDVIVS